MPKWTEEITYKFVQEYLRNPCLYNCNDPNYKVKDDRDAAFRRISKAMNIPGFGSKDVYTKIRNLRSTYSQELKKVKDSTKSGSDNVYNPHIKWFKLLDNAIKAVNLQTLTTTYSQAQSTHNVKLEPLPETADEEEPSTSHNQPAEENGPDASSEPPPHDEEEQIKSPIPRKRTKQDLKRLVIKVKDMADTINTPMQTETEFDIFGRSVAAQLKSMPLHQAIEGQMFIQNYLCHLRLQQMGHGTPNYACNPAQNSMYTFTPLPFPNFPYTQPPQIAPHTPPPPDSPSQSILPDPPKPNVD